MILCKIVNQFDDFFVLLGRQIFAREAGSNKQSASKSCSLSLVRQLYHLGVIEAFSGTLKKNKGEFDIQLFVYNLNFLKFSCLFTFLQKWKSYPHMTWLYLLRLWTNSMILWNQWNILLWMLIWFTKVKTSWFHVKYVW